jgi:transcriptional regulator with XRE-family HTH domain
MNSNTSTGEMFLQWLDAEEKAKGWTDYELSKKAGISHSMLSRARNDLLPPKWDALVKLAVALDRSPITAFRAAGLLPPGPVDEITFDDWKFLLEQLEPAEQEELRQIAVLKIERRKKQEQSARAANFKPGTVQK